ncbi:MAG TPA: class I SAM-dependent methyltransferase [Bryobacteraceae bacterium]|nr:class I SAM-dependent methyltransferase [Bryobacteraceae bacterium]
MLELIQGLPRGARVLDLGSGSGSFQTTRDDIGVIRLDVEIPAVRAPGAYVSADAARMPFRPRAFDLVIGNHSLEHFPALDETLREIARIMQSGGVLYVAVPDVSTFTDRLYRWMAKGGGHVNAFDSEKEVIRRIERITGLPHRATRTLYTSLSFLNARNFKARPPRKIALFANGNEDFLAALTWFLRLLDRTFGSRLSVYGWSFYFGNIDLPKVLEPWINVCVRCGSGISEDYLRKVGAVGPIPGVWDRYLCPICGGRNRFTRVNL